MLKYCDGMATIFTTETFFIIFPEVGEENTNTIICFPMRRPENSRIELDMPEAVFDRAACGVTTKGFLDLTPENLSRIARTLPTKPLDVQEPR